MSLEEVQHLDAEHKASVTAGDLEAPKQWKIHSDAGKRKRKQQDDTLGLSLEDNKEEHVMKKERRSLKESGTTKSKEFVTDMDSE